MANKKKKSPVKQSQSKYETQQMRDRYKSDKELKNEGLMSHKGSQQYHGKDYIPKNKRDAFNKVMDNDQRLVATEKRLNEIRNEDWGLSPAKQVRNAIGRHPITQSVSPLQRKEKFDSSTNKGISTLYTGKRKGE